MKAENLISQNKNALHAQPAPAPPLPRNLSKWKSTIAKHRKYLLLQIPPSYGIHGDKALLESKSLKSRLFDVGSKASFFRIWKKKPSNVEEDISRKSYNQIKGEIKSSRKLNHSLWRTGVGTGIARCCRRPGGARRVSFESFKSARGASDGVFLDLDPDGSTAEQNPSFDWVDANTTWICPSMTLDFCMKMKTENKTHVSRYYLTYPSDYLWLLYESVRFMTPKKYVEHRNEIYELTALCYLVGPWWMFGHICGVQQLNNYLPELRFMKLDVWVEYMSAAICVWFDVVFSCSMSLIVTKLELSYDWSHLIENLNDFETIYFHANSLITTPFISMMNNLIFPLVTSASFFIMIAKTCTLDAHPNLLNINAPSNWFNRVTHNNNELVHQHRRNFRNKIIVTPFLLDLRHADLCYLLNYKLLKAPTSLGKTQVSLPEPNARFDPYKSLLFIPELWKHRWNCVYLCLNCSTGIINLCLQATKSLFITPLSKNEIIKYEIFISIIECAWHPYYFDLELKLGHLRTVLISLKFKSVIVDTSCYYLKWPLYILPLNENGIMEHDSGKTDNKCAGHQCCKGAWHKCCTDFEQEFGSQKTEQKCPFLISRNVDSSANLTKWSLYRSRKFCEPLKEPGNARLNKTAYASIVPLLQGPTKMITVAQAKVNILSSSNKEQSIIPLKIDNGVGRITTPLPCKGSSPKEQWKLKNASIMCIFESSDQWKLKNASNLCILESPGVFCYLTYANHNKRSTNIYHSNRHILNAQQCLVAKQKDHKNGKNPGHFHPNTIYCFK